MKADPPLSVPLYCVGFRMRFMAFYLVSTINSILRWEEAKECLITATWQVVEGYAPARKQRVENHRWDECNSNFYVNHVVVLRYT